MSDRESSHGTVGAQGAKHCARCGVDCSNLARLKDSKGRYYCRECYDRAVATMASLIVRTAPSMPAASNSMRGTPSSTDGPGESGIFDVIEPDDTPTVAMRPCPNCGRDMPHDSVACSRCGFNTILGREVDRPDNATVTAAMRGGVLACGKCGYSLRNLKSLTCPECGTPNRIPSRRDQLHEDSRDIVRRTYLRAFVYLGIGIAGLAVLGAMDAYATLAPLAKIGAPAPLSEGLKEFARSTGGYLLAYLFDLPFSIGAFLLCSVLWLGVNEQIRLTIVRLAGVFALVSLVIFIFGGIGALALLIAGTGYVMFLHHEMELDISDAWLVGFVTLGVKVTSMICLRIIGHQFGWW